MTAKAGPTSGSGLAAGHPSVLAGGLAPGACLLGVDLGSKTIGLAVSDPSLTIASPIATLPRTRLGADAPAIAAIARERNVGGLVVGLPLNMNGSEGRAAQMTRDWSAELAGRLGLPVAFWDERMSTMAVERAMLEADLSRRRRARKIDQAAAAWILQGALDALPRRSAG